MRTENFWEQASLGLINTPKFTSKRKKLLGSRKSRLKLKYGITLNEYNALLNSQGGGCAICGRTENNRSLSIDHDHRTGKVRGILCANCNWLLGFAKDDPEILRKAILYLTSV